MNHEVLPLNARLRVLIAAFLGWMMAGTIMVIVPLSGRAAIRSMGITDEAEVGKWFSWLVCAFLLGAAAGGLLFGWLGDRLGRAKAMGLSILCYSILTGVTYWADSPTQLLVLRFLACMGVGGMWPNGVALASEAWSDVSRPMLSGLIGTSANLGFMLFSGLSIYYPVRDDSWRWLMLVGALPAVLGVLTLLVVPESPSWLKGQSKSGASASVTQVFRPPLLRLTLIGICLGAIPLMGNWGSANWMIPWADRFGGEELPQLKAWTQWCKSFGGALGALLGGWVANQLGRRTTYFLISLISLGISSYVFFALTPASSGFLAWVFAIGFFGTLYFGWLPLYLPELFPMSVRSTGAGVSFNWGRILTAFGVLGTGRLMVAFSGDYARVGQITCLVFLLGMVVICFAPDTSGKSMSQIDES